MFSGTTLEHEPSVNACLIDSIMSFHPDVLDLLCFQTNLFYSYSSRSKDLMKSNNSEDIECIRPHRIYTFQFSEKLFLIYSS